MGLGRERAMMDIAFASDLLFVLLGGNNGPTNWHLGNSALLVSGIEAFKRSGKLRNNSRFQAQSSSPVI